MESGAKETVSSVSTVTTTTTPSSSAQSFSYPQLPQDPLPQTSIFPQVSPLSTTGDSPQTSLPSFESVIGGSTYSSNNVAGGYDSVMDANNVVGGYDSSLDTYLSNLGDVGNVATQNVGMNISTYQNATQGVVDPHQGWYS